MTVPTDSTFEHTGVPMPTAQQMAIIDLTEDIATWLENCARGGRLTQRIRMADQLRTGAWRSMPPRRGAPVDVARARAVMIPIPTPWIEDLAADVSTSRPTRCLFTGEETCEPA